MLKQLFIPAFLALITLSAAGQLTAAQIAGAREKAQNRYFGEKPPPGGKAPKPDDG